MKIFEKLCDGNRPVLSDRTIMEYNKKQLLIEQPISESQLQPNSVDLTLATSVSVLKHNSGEELVKYIDTRKPIEYYSYEFNTATVTDEKRYGIPAGTRYYILHPGKFCLLASREILNIPNGILSFVQGRSSIARLAIQTEQAGLIDSGFRGTITFEVYNQSEFPIVIYEGMRVAQVYFFKAEKAEKIYGKDKNSKYSGQIEATGSRINEDPELKH